MRREAGALNGTLFGGAGELRDALFESEVPPTGGAVFAGDVDGALLGGEASLAAHFFRRQRGALGGALFADEVRRA